MRTRAKRVASVLDVRLCALAWGALIAGALIAGAPAQATHIPGATYKGTHAGGGTVSLTVSDDGSAIVSFSAKNVPGFSCTFTSFSTNFRVPISDHKFGKSNPSSTFGMNGSFRAVQGVRGTFYIQEPGCTTEGPDETPNVPFSATTTSRPPDTTPPETTITKRPSRKSTDRTPTFKFKSSEAGSTFKCSLDGGRSRSCGSPYTTHKLAYGKHTFKVKAIDRAGNTDPSPESSSFKVVRRR